MMNNIKSDDGDDDDDIKRTLSMAMYMTTANGNCNATDNCTTVSYSIHRACKPSTTDPAPITTTTTPQCLQAPALCFQGPCLATAISLHVPRDSPKLQAQFTF